MHNNPVRRSSNTRSRALELGEQRIPVAVLWSPRRKSGGVAPVSAASISITNGDPTGKPVSCHWGESTSTGLCVATEYKEATWSIVGKPTLLGAKKEVDLAAGKGDVFSFPLLYSADFWSTNFCCKSSFKERCSAICMGAGPDDEALCSFCLGLNFCVSLTDYEHHYCQSCLLPHCHNHLVHWDQSQVVGWLV